MKALILAGGYGTRLRPLTFTRPKHMLPIANRPHIDHVFDLLLRHGINEAVLLTSYLSEAFDDAISTAAARGLRVETTFEKEPLGTAGAFKNAEDFVGEEAFVAFNGDVLTDLDLSAVLDWHREREAEATIVLHAVEDPSAYGVVPTDETGRVLGFVEKPPRGEAPTNLINAGIYIFEPSILDRIPVQQAWSAERQLFPQLVEEGARLYAQGTDAYWMDIGTPEKYVQANLDALLGSYRVPGLSVEDGAVLKGADVSINTSASVKACCLGDGCRVEDAIVEESVLLEGARVGSKAVVRRSVLGAGVSVTPGTEVIEKAVADGDIV
jgi:mannose-1-phosphate guanylyltransferase